MGFAKSRYMVLFGVLIVTAAGISSVDWLDGDQQVPISLDRLARDSMGTIQLNRRIASVRPGGPIHVGFTLNGWDQPAGQELVAAVYSAKDGSLVHVLGQTSVRSTGASRHQLAVHLPVEGLSTDSSQSVYRLALIAPHTSPAGERLGYSTGTMLVCM
ncbi:hypothetical protein IWW51_002852 [Coemansia sp. RSA 2702]|nr:hypothetical protein IWW51_002852 [Coemansia sp. RSA 2702]